MHDKLYHLFVISRDLEEFAHIHPEAHADGSFTIEHTLPKPGHYVLFSDFLARGGGAQITATPIVTAGVDADIVAAQAQLKPDMPWVRTADGVRVSTAQRTVDSSSVGKRSTWCFASPTRRPMHP